MPAKYVPVLVGALVAGRVDGLTTGPSQMSGVPSRFDITKVAMGVQDLTPDDMGRRRGLHQHSTQMRRRDEHFSNTDTSIEAHAALLHLDFTWEEQDIHLICRRNDVLIGKDYTIKDGERTVHGAERCYYVCQGSGLLGGLSTCGKLHGSFRTEDDDEIYLGPIEPEVAELATATAVSSEDPIHDVDAYCVYRRSQCDLDVHDPKVGRHRTDKPSYAQEEEIAEASAEEASNALVNSPEDNVDVRRRAETGKRNKYIGLLIGLGPGFIDYHNNRANAPGAENFMLQIMNNVGVAYAEDVFNYDLFTVINEVRFFSDYQSNCGRGFDGKPMPCGLETYQEFRSGRRWNFLRGDGDAMLQTWTDYVQSENSGSGRSLKWDTAQFLGAYDIFADRNRGGTIGYAWVGSVCKPWSTGINEVLRESSWDIVAHELGHNCGAEHDSEGGNRCSPSGYIMAAASGGDKSYRNGFWSDCSVQYFNNYLGRQSCLETNQNPASVPERPSYEWRTIGFGECSTNCGQGTQTSTVGCYNKASNALVASSFCSGLSNPSTTRPCTSNSGCTTTTTCGLSDVQVSCGGCTALVSIRQYGTCDRYCRANGFVCVAAWDDTVNGQCSGAQQFSCSTDFSSRTSDAICRCGEGPSYEWRTIGFGECSADCGQGTQTSVVRCYNKDNGALVASSFCSGLSNPSTTRPCSSTSGCETPNAGICDNLSDVERSCGPCRALVSIRQYGTCDRYCRANGLACTGAWDDTIDERCEGARQYSCDFSFRGTSDAICECGEPGSQPPVNTCKDDPAFRDKKGKTCAKLKEKDCYKCKPEKGEPCGYIGCPKKCGTCA